jgi:conjugative transfer signal peptidase TraF
MRTRAVTIAATIVAAVSVTATTGAKPKPRLVWNVSESAPIGLYRVRSASEPFAGDLVVAYPPEALADFLAEQGYLSPAIPLIKRVLAVAGQTVCRNELLVTVDGRPMGAARHRDRKGRLLPVWQGCRVVAAGEVFLMNRDAPDSLDGRYFGPLPVDTIAGRAEPLWTQEASQSCASHCKHQLNSLRLGGRND